MLSCDMRAVAAEGRWLVRPWQMVIAPTVNRPFDRVADAYRGKTFREGRSFEKAYLIDFLQHLIEDGTVMHRVDTPGGYMEIDTLQDRELAEAWWRGES